MGHDAPRSRIRKDLQKLVERIQSAQDVTQNATQHDELSEDLAAMIEPDGGMPGDNIEERVLSTMIVLIYLTQEGSTRDTGAFQSHMNKLMNFLEVSMEQVDVNCQAHIWEVLQDVEAKKVPSIDIENYLTDIVNKKFKATSDIWNAIFA